MKLASAVVVCLTAIGLTACGSSHHRSYSVQQVESAFAAHGITLIHTRQRSTGAVLSFVGRGGVRVLVLSTPNAAFGWTGERPIRRANLIVFRPPASKHAVNAALHDLTG